MARIAGIELNDNWKVDYALTRIKGIGWARSEEILESLKLARKNQVKDLSKKDLSNIANKLEDYTIEGELIRNLRENIQRLKVIKSYRGLRHEHGLPARGQRTKSNARTKRGSRKTVGAYRKDMLTKMQQTK